MNTTISQDKALAVDETLVCRRVVRNGLVASGLDLVARPGNQFGFGDLTHKVIIGKSGKGMSFRGNEMRSGSVSCAGGLLAGLLSRI